MFRTSRSCQRGQAALRALTSAATSAYAPGVPVVHAIIGLAAWAGLLGLHNVWQRFCQRHPEVADRFAPPQPNWVGDEAEEWLKAQDQCPKRST